MTLHEAEPKRAAPSVWSQVQMPPGMAAITLWVVLC